MRAAGVGEGGAASPRQQPEELRLRRRGVCLRRGTADLGRERSPGHVMHALTSICAERPSAGPLFLLPSPFCLSLFVTPPLSLVLPLPLGSLWVLWAVLRARPWICFLHVASICFVSFLRRSV